MDEDAISWITRGKESIGFRPLFFFFFRDSSTIIFSSVDSMSVAIRAVAVGTFSSPAEDEVQGFSSEGGGWRGFFLTLICAKEKEKESVAERTKSEEEEEEEDPLQPSFCLAAGATSEQVTESFSKSTPVVYF